MSSSDQIGDNDSLHILPLSNITLQVAALKETRLIKNTKLEGVIELFSGATTGSGQVTPERLADVFDFSGEREKDLSVVKTLADLPSYDVYSLRLSLKKAHVEVDDIENLSLSEQMAESLNPYMTTYTRPLATKIYGTGSDDVRSFKDVLILLTNEHAVQARKNLSELAAQLEIGLSDVPQFLEDCADVYLSLAYYQKCYSDNASGFDAFVRDLETLALTPSLKARPAAVRQIESAVETFRDLYRAAGNILTALRARTSVLWEDISAQRFRKMTELVLSHQEKIGALLCAITVKLNAWQQYAASAITDSAADKANFVNSNMMYGLDALSGLKFQEA